MWARKSASSSREASFCPSVRLSRARPESPRPLLPAETRSRACARTASALSSLRNESPTLPLRDRASGPSDSFLALSVLGPGAGAGGGDDPAGAGERGAGERGGGVAPEVQGRRLRPGQDPDGRG